MVILQPDLSDQELQGIFEKIGKKIESLSGKVLIAKIWEKERNFYYFLKSRGAEKKKYYKGCYWFVSFSIDTEKLADLKEMIRLEERILRHLILNRENALKGAFAPAQ
jgi:ribosomal protein S6